ncbi:MAG: malate dehydrogenase [Gammaproteobacteria bacterium]|nr:malate dehydrogenase [Gammaproteobacteria bacterium]
MNKKLGLVGAGNIGGTLGLLAALAEYQEIALFDVKPGLAKGKALDLGQAAALHGSSSRITGSDSFAILEDCDCVVVTAGSPRLPGMSRDDLLSVNAKVMQSVGQAIAQYCPGAFVICVTNPLDAMVYLLQHASKIPDHRIVGMAGILDSARFRYFLSDYFKTGVQNIHALVLGGHGDTMVPLVRHTLVDGISLEKHVELGRLPAADLEAIIQRTRQGGGEIVALLQTGSAFIAPARSAFEMVQAHLRDEKKLLPVAAKVTVEFNVPQPMFLGVPVILGAKGVEKIIQYEFTEQEQQGLTNSAAAVASLIEDMHRLGFLSE